MTEVLPEILDISVKKPEVSLGKQIRDTQEAARKHIDRVRGLNPTPTDSKSGTRPTHEPPLRKGHPPQIDERTTLPTTTQPSETVSIPQPAFVGKSEWIGVGVPKNEQRTLRADELSPITDDGVIDLGTIAIGKTKPKETTPLPKKIADGARDLIDRAKLLAYDPKTIRRIIAAGIVAGVVTAALNGPLGHEVAMLHAIPNVDISVPLDPELIKGSHTLQDYISLQLTLKGGYSGEQTLPNILADITTELNKDTNLQYGQEGYQVLDKTSFKIITDLYSNPSLYDTGEGKFENLLAFDGYKTGAGDKHETTKNLLDLLHKYRNLLTLHPDSYSIGESVNNSRIVVVDEGELQGMFLPTPPIEPQGALLKAGTPNTTQAIAAALAVTGVTPGLTTEKAITQKLSKDQE